MARRRRRSRKARARRSAPVAPPRRRSRARRAIRYVKVRGRRRFRQAREGIGSVLVKGVAVAGATWASSKLANKLPISDNIAKGLTVAGTGVALALGSGAAGRMASRVPVVRKVVTKGTVGLLGVGLVADGAVRVVKDPRVQAKVRGFLPGGGGSAPAQKVEKLPEAGTVARGGGARDVAAPMTYRIAQRN